MQLQLRKREITLLQTWMDRLIADQITSPNPRFDGGALCPSCLHFHGRVIDSIYPLMTLADLTGDERYRISAERFFLFGGIIFIVMITVITMTPNRPGIRQQYFFCAVVRTGLNRAWANPLAASVRYLDHTLTRNFEVDV
ncbi:hypothetical protein [Lacticaseibacillus camelliae]|uniref:hypothetical protein n=1 Tax=Lacticaseibacillus camelliae TaxID=381742 RepID=UPI0006D0D7D2|nr:hypothetical protein [Lacticaseibacillus camelliae]